MAAFPKSWRHGNGMMEIARVRITDAGRRALKAAMKP
jgi:hypothetical protein